MSGSSLEEKADHFVQKAKENPQWAHDILINYVSHGKQRVNVKKDLAAGTLQTVFRTIKLFYENNDLETTTSTAAAPINWRRISKGLPKTRTKANDRAYTTEEIHKLVEHSDRRMKAIVYTMCSSGIRAGAWSYLRWKHVKPITDDKTGGIIVAKLTVYADQPEQYYTFITPEAYNALKDYIDYRTSAGEEITDDSWLVRDSWKTTDVKYGAKASLATNPKPLKAHTIEKLLGRALRAQNVRNPLTKGLRRHEYKAAHGLRKFFDNAADSAGVRYLHIEYLMGHDIGITGNYRRFQEQKLLEDYLKAVPFLTISSQKTTQLQQQVAQLTAINEAVVREAEEKARELQRKQDDLKVMQEELVAIYRGMLEHFELNEPKTWKTVVKKTDPPKPSIESIDKIEQYCYNGNPNNNDDASYNNLQHLKEKLKPRSNYYSASFLEDLTQAAAATLAAKKEYEQEEKQWRTDRQQRQHITNPKTD